MVYDVGMAKFVQENNDVVCNSCKALVGSMQDLLYKDVDRIAVANAMLDSLENIHGVVRKLLMEVVRQ